MIPGYLGGSFDPVHLGHLSLAVEAKERFSLDKVIFVPSRFPPHKDPGGLTAYNHREKMLELAVSGRSFFQVADLEGQSTPSYTVDFLQRVSALHHRPCFIVGMDSLCEMHTWKEPYRIVEIARVLVGVRPGFSSEKVDKDLLSRVELFEFPGVHISSSDVRKRVEEGRCISYLVPESVESYIRSRGLYGTEKSH